MRLPIFFWSHRAIFSNVALTKCRDSLSQVKNVVNKKVLCYFSGAICQTLVIGYQNDIIRLASHCKFVSSARSGLSRRIKLMNPDFLHSTAIGFISSQCVSALRPQNQTIKFSTLTVRQSSTSRLRETLCLCAITDSALLNQRSLISGKHIAFSDTLAEFHWRHIVEVFFINLLGRHYSTTTFCSGLFSDVQVTPH